MRWVLVIKTPEGTTVQIVGPFNSHSEAKFWAITARLAPHWDIIQLNSPEG